MSNELTNLLRKLDSRTLITWLPEMKLGKPAYDFIRTALLGSTLKTNQQCNALQALFRLRGHASDQEVFQLYVQFASHPNKKVRTTAVKLGIGLLRLRRSLDCISTPIPVDSDIDAFRHALDLGIERQIETLTRDFLAA